MPCGSTSKPSPTGTPRPPSCYASPTARPARSRNAPSPTSPNGPPPPPALVEGLKTLLKGGTAVAHLAQTFDIVRSLPPGHVAAVLGLMRSLRFQCLLDPDPSSERDRALALIAARVLDLASKLATARDSLADTLALGELDENALYGAMD